MNAPSFTTWLRSLGPALRLELSPAQLAMWRVLGDGAAPVADDLGYALFGGTFEVSSDARRCAVLRKGARVGGSMISAYRLTHLALTVNLDGLARGERASGIVCAPDLRLARQVLSYIGGLLDVLGLKPDTKSIESATFTRRDGREVTLECLPATAGGRAVRARSLVGAIMSEAAFFRDADYAVNDDEIYRALMPRIVRGGQLIIESTPWAETGLLFSLDDKNFGAPDTCVVAHAPTTLLRPDMADIVAAERRRDPQNAAREFDAEYLTAGSGLFFDPVAIDACIDDSIELPATASGEAFAGADWAFESDSSALVMSDVQPTSEGPVVTVVYVNELQPARGKPLRTDDVVATFAEAVRSYGAASICADAHYRRAIAEHLEKHGMLLEDAPAGRPGKTTTYIRTRELVNAGRLGFRGTKG